MKRRTTTSALLGIVLILLHAAGPVLHRAWGHDDSCSGCAHANASEDRWQNRPDACPVCAVIGALQTVSLIDATRAAHPIEGSNLRVDRFAAESHPSPLFSSGGARAPPR